MTRRRVNESGAVYDKDYFVELWHKYLKQFPTSPVRIVIRNLNDLTEADIVLMTLPMDEAKVIGINVKFGTRIYGFDIDLSKVLPDKAMELLKAGRLRKRKGEHARKYDIPGDHFIQVGQRLCDLLERELTIDLRSGGGHLNNKDSDSTTFFPKKPGKKARKPVHKSVAGSWET